MPTITRNVLAGLMIMMGALMVVSAPLSAADVVAQCGDVLVNFDDHDPAPLHKNNQSVGPVAITLAAGTYDILLTSTDPSHGAGLHLDQVHESWFFTLDNGFVSATTPDFPDDQMGTAIVQQAVTLTAASQITAFWAGVVPSFDSVHAVASFTCTRETIVTTTTTTTGLPTTTAQVTSTTAASTTTTTSAVTTTSAAPTTIAGTATTLASPSTTAAPLTPTTLAAQPTSTTEQVGQIGGTTEDNPELAATGMNLNLAVGGFALIGGGFSMVVLGSMHDRRKLAIAAS